MLRIDEIVEKIEVKESKASPYKSTFVVEPLYRGYGHTLGNSLRRILLSSILGAAVKAVKIDNVVSEFSTIDGIKENVVDILLNMKGVVVRASQPGEKIAKISVTGPATVTAADISSGDFEVVNKEHVIAHITDKSTFNMEVMVDTGRGFQVAEEMDKSDWPVGFLAVDALYSPIRGVDYTVEDTRVGRMTNFDRLTFNIETNGSIDAKEIMSYAVELYISHLKPFLNLGDAMSNLRPKTSSSMLQEPQSNSSKTRIEDLDLSVRSYNCLKRSDINTLEDLLKLSQKELLSIKNLGKSSVAEIKAKLEELGVNNEA